MKLLRKLEFACGLITLLCEAVFIAVIFGTNEYGVKSASNPADVGSAILMGFIPSVVPFAAYAHAIKRTIFGFYLLLVCGLLSIGLFLLLFLVIGTFYSAWLTLVAIAPYLMTWITFVLALFTDTK